MLCRPEDCLLEIGVFKELHVSGVRPLACQARAYRSPASRPKSNLEKGFSELRRRRIARRFFPSCWPIAPIIARTRGGSETAILSRRSKRPFSDNSMTVRRMVFFRRQLARPARPAQEVEQSRIAFGEGGPRFGSARMDDGIAANEFSRKAESAGSNLVLLCRLRRESEKISGGDTRREDTLAPRGEPLDRGGVRPALPEGCVTGTVVDALAQALESHRLSRS